jgi:hypothetical protein
MKQPTRTRIVTRTWFRALGWALLLAVAAALAPLEATAQQKEAAGAAGKEDLGAVGAKLANPLGSLWSLVMNFETPKFFDGNVSTGDPEMGADMIFQPVVPIPLYGSGKAQWRLITRPVIPLIFSQPVPEGLSVDNTVSGVTVDGLNDFDHRTGIGDIQLPALLAVPGKYAGHWILGAGPVGLFPSATDDKLGSDQWALGPAVVLGYKTKSFTAVLFPNYFWKVGESGQHDETPDINRGTLLYQLVLNLPDAWQVGFNPTITYNHQAKSENKWNVPVGLFAGKTIKVGKTPVNIKAGLEYSVVSEDTYGKRAAFRFQITPVVPSLIQNPIFGGGS